MGEVTDLASHRDDVFHQRKLTQAVLQPWGLIPAVYGYGKRPIEKLTAETGKAVDPVAWGTPGSPQSKFTLLGRLTPSLIDLDLDVRLTDRPNTRPIEWTKDEKAAAEEMFYRPFREEIKRLTFDTRNHWGRASMGGTGHWLIPILSEEELSLDERRDRLKPLEFELNVGMFKAKLEVRFPRKAGSQLTVVLPGSRYEDGDHVSFYRASNLPFDRDTHILAQPVAKLCQAVYAAALRMACGPLTGEGERHNTALLVSGVLRREVEAAEQDGGSGFNRDEARRLFEEIFAHDTEIEARRRIFEADFANDDSSELPGYPALGRRIGEGTADAIARMLHGYDRAPIERMREHIVFLQDDSAQCVDLSEATAGNNLTLYPRHALALHHNQVLKTRRGKIQRVFQKLQELPSRRQVNGWIMAPGYDQGALLYQVGGGRLSPTRQAETDRVLINRAPGWDTPYVEDDLASYDDAQATLDHMISWFTDNPHHHRKIMQVIAFKVQNPLIKPQFALAVVGGQGIGKSTFFFEVMRAVLGKSVTATSVHELYSPQYTFSTAIGASLLIIEEADAIPDFSLSKQLHRSSELDVNLKYAAKGTQWSFCIPIYLTNKSNPRLQEQGVVDRTLYVIEAPTQESMKLTAAEWIAFRQKRTVETDVVRAKLKDPQFLLALRQIFEEFEVTQVELQDTSKSDSFTEEYAVHELAPDQLVLQTMLARGYVHHDHPDWAFDAPITKLMFDDAYNQLYRYFAGRQERVKSTQYISKQLVKMLGDAGTLESFQKYKEGRVYWFPYKLGTLRKWFAVNAGVPVPDETQAEEGRNEPDVDACARAWAYWKKAGSGLTGSADY